MAKKEQVDRDVASRRLIANNLAEMRSSNIPSVQRNFVNYMNAYSFAFPKCQLAGYWKKLESLIADFTENIETYDLSLSQLNFYSLIECL